MDIPHIYQIRVEGHLTERWSDWFDGILICSGPGDETILTGQLPDQAALYRILHKIHDLNLVLVSVTRSSVDEHA